MDFGFIVYITSWLWSLDSVTDVSQLVSTWRFRVVRRRIIVACLLATAMLEYGVGDGISFFTLQSNHGDHLVYVF